MRDITGGPLDLMSRRMIGASSQELVNQTLPLLSFTDMGRD